MLALPHAEVDLDGVAITWADVLPGDGYDAYLKPFRTIEDLHVHAAVTGYLLGVARRQGWDGIVERALATAVAARGLATADARHAATHRVLAGGLGLAGRLIADVEATWAAAADEEWAR